MSRIRMFSGRCFGASSSMRLALSLMLRSEGPTSLAESIGTILIRAITNLKRDILETIKIIRIRKI